MKIRGWEGSTIKHMPMPGKNVSTAQCCGCNKGSIIGTGDVVLDQGNLTTFSCGQLLLTMWPFNTSKPQGSVFSPVQSPSLLLQPQSLCAVNQSDFIRVCVRSKLKPDQVGEQEIEQGNDWIKKRLLLTGVGMSKKQHFAQVQKVRFKKKLFLNCKQMKIQCVQILLDIHSKKCPQSLAHSSRYQGLFYLLFILIISYKNCHYYHLK